MNFQTDRREGPRLSQQQQNHCREHFYLRVYLVPY